MPVRPDAETDAATWIEFVYFRDNPRGVHAELWQHVLGCRAWLVVIRDTGSHAVIRVEPASGFRRQR